jgi:hypothetical protein
MERFGGASRDRTDDLIVANDDVSQTFPCVLNHFPPQFVTLCHKKIRLAELPQQFTRTRTRKNRAGAFSSNFFKGAIVGKIGVLRIAEDRKSETGETIIEVQREILADPENELELCTIAIGMGLDRVRFVPVDDPGKAKGGA